MKMTPVFTYHFRTFQIVEGEEGAYQALHANISHLSCRLVSSQVPATASEVLRPPVHCFASSDI